MDNKYTKPQPPKKIKKGRSNRRHLLRNFTFSSLLLLGTALGGTTYIMESYQPEKFYSPSIVIGKDTIPPEVFYENLESKNGEWFYNNRETGTYINLNKSCDYTTFGDKRFREFSKLKPQFKIDTVTVKSNPHKGNSVYYAIHPQDSLKNMPAFGNRIHNKIIIRYFRSDNPVLNKKYQENNDDYNCTTRHEFQHFLNIKSGIERSGQSYEVKFAELCMDEVSANIAQLLEQRKNFFKYGKDYAHICARFIEYRHYLEQHPETAEKDITPAEAKFIAEYVFDSWHKDKYPIYIRRNVGRTRYIYYGLNYNAYCVNRPELHNQTMHKIFNIDNIDFYQYIQGREQVFIDELPPAHKETFARLTAEHKRRMTYLDKIGQFTDNDDAQKNNYFNGLKLKHLWNKLIGRTHNK